MVPFVEAGGEQPSWAGTTHLEEIIEEKLFMSLVTSQP